MTTIAPHAPPPVSTPPRGLQVLAAAGIAGIGLLFAAYVLVVRAEARPGLAAGSLLILGVAGAVLAGVRWAPLLAVPLGLAVVDRLAVYVPFSLARPDETGGLVFSALCLVVVSVAVAAGVAATWQAYGRPLARPLAVVGAGAALVLLALTALLVPQAQPDQGDGLTAEQVAALPRVVMDDYRYAPDVLTATVGTELAVLLVNDDTETYRFVVDALGVDVVVPSGREAVVRLVPTAPGSLAFYSSEEAGEHRALGMVGTVLVTE